MKYTPLLIALTLGLTTLPPAARADRDWFRDYHDEGTRDLHERVRHLRDHYERVKDEAEHAHADHRAWDRLHDIRHEIDRVTEFVESGHFDPSRASEKISRLNEALHEIWADVRHGGDHHEGGDRRSGFSIEIR